MKLFLLHLRLIGKFCRFYFRAHSLYNVHSAFVASFARYVLEDRRVFYAFDKAQEIRGHLLNDARQLELNLHGAGSQVTSSNKRSVKEIARHSAVPAWVGRWLFRATLFCKPQTILELGTSLGISMMYLGAAAKNAKKVTIEGCSSTAEVAAGVFSAIKLSQVQSLVGTFDQRLPEALLSLGKVDLVFIDGDHSEGSTLRYFEKIKPHLHSNSLVIIADIHWSQEMEKAWKILTGREDIRLSIDCFSVGFLFFRHEHLQKEHYRLLPSRILPWRTGIWGKIFTAKE